MLRKEEIEFFSKIKQPHVEGTYATVLVKPLEKKSLSGVIRVKEEYHYSGVVVKSNAKDIKEGDIVHWTSSSMIQMFEVPDLEVQGEISKNRYVAIKEPDILYYESK
jgi:hypothetical protein